MLSPLEEIKNRLDIVDIVSQYVKLTKAGANYKALCPFHKEKTPSFFVSPSRQIWHCFGACNEGGDIFKFIMKIENIDFKEAVRFLAEKAGVKIAFERPEIHSLKQRLIAINQEALNFFKKNLENTLEVKAYLKKRGLKEETINLFELGYAPDNWRALLIYLLKKGYKLEDIFQTGLIIFKKEPEEISQKNQIFKGLNPEDFYDRFRSRIIFPIRDKNGILVGFTGRIFQGKIPLKTIKDIEAVGKYVNSPQSLIFDKSKILYGFHLTKEEIFKNGEAIIVEGQMDFLMSYQSGLKNIVATSGTSLTNYHLDLLKKYCSTIVLAFDMDEAGQKASERTIDLGLEYNFQVKILLLEKGKDLADYFLLERDSSKLLKNVTEIMDFYFNRAKSLADKKTLEGKKIIAGYFLPKIKKLPNAIDRAFWLEKLANYLNISLEILTEEFKKIKDEKKELVKAEVNLNFEEENRLEKITKRIIAFLIDDPKRKEMISEYLDYFSEKYHQILEIVSKANTKEELLPQALSQSNIKEELILLINQLALQADYEKEILSSFKVDIQQEIKNSLKELKKEFLKRQISSLEQEIKEAEKNKDEKKLEKLLREVNRLIKEYSLSK